MKAITPENEIPPAHKTAASGTLPTEHTNESAATTGPSTTLSSRRGVAEECVRNSRLKNDIGRSATKPAITKPAVISFHSISQSPRKLCATSDHASIEVRRSRHVISSVPALWCWWPASACSAWTRASASARRETNRRIAAHISAIKKIPPTNSASVNCQPRKIHMTIPISNTRFVDANWNAIAEAIATAA